MDAWDIASLIMFVILFPIGMWVIWQMCKEIISSMIDEYKKYPKRKSVDYLVAIWRPVRVLLVIIAAIVIMLISANLSGY